MGKRGNERCASKVRWRKRDGGERRDGDVADFGRMCRTVDEEMQMMPDIFIKMEARLIDGELQFRAIPFKQGEAPSES